MKKLGFGCMRLPLVDGKDDKNILLSEVSQMVDLFLSRGYRYFDTAYPYHGGKGEEAVRKALVERHKRDEFLLADKLPVWLMDKASDMERIFHEQQERTGCERFDYYLVHSIDKENLKKIEEYDAFSFCDKLREKGLIDHFGFSFHDSPELLDRLLNEHPEVEFVQLQINYLDWDDAVVRSGRNYEVARKHGKRVWIMEPVKGGLLANLPPMVHDLFRQYAPSSSDASMGYRFCADLEGVDMILSGMHSLSQMEDNLSTFDNLKPLTPEERVAIGKAVDMIAKANPIKCTGCRYCIDGCPKHIPIPRLFLLYNQSTQFDIPQRFQRQYGTLDHHAGECVKCGACKRVCPQHLDVPSLLGSVAKKFESA